MHVEPHHTPDQLAALLRAEPRAKVARRLAAVRLALLGQTAPAVAAQVLLSDRQSPPGWRATTAAAPLPSPTGPAAAGPAR
jgi:hypothetical protein